MNQTTNITSPYINCVNTTNVTSSTIDCHEDDEEEVAGVGTSGGGVFTSKMFVTGLAILTVTMFLVAYIRFMFVVLGWKRKRIVVPMPTRSATHNTTTNTTTNNNTLAHQRLEQRNHHDTDIIRLEVGGFDHGDQDDNDDDFSIRRRSTFATPLPILQEVVTE